MYLLIENEILRMKIAKTWLIAVPVTLLFACTDTSRKEKKDTAEAPQIIKGQVQDTGAISSLKLNDETLHAIYLQYKDLTAALIDNDVVTATIAANAIEAGAKEMQGGSPIAAAASGITNARDIESQRTAFSSLSNHFIELVRKSGLESGELFVDYCPMALNDKGANWLSNMKEIRNPYFGDKMLTCGEVKEVIK